MVLTLFKKVLDFTNGSLKANLFYVDNLHRDVQEFPNLPCGMIVCDPVCSSKPVCTSHVPTSKSVCTGNVPSSKPVCTSNRRTSKPVCTSHVRPGKPACGSNVCESKPVCASNIRSS